MNDIVMDEGMKLDNKRNHIIYLIIIKEGFKNVP